MVKSKHYLWGTWTSMLRRCESPKHKAYKYYGGKGVKVCPEWHDFWNFAEWAEKQGGRKQGQTLDRINSNGDYCPENCRFASMRTQSLNKCSNIRITYDNQTKTIQEWSEITGICHETLRNRYWRGWAPEKIINTTPPKLPHPHNVKPKVLQYNLNNQLINTYDNLQSVPNEYSKKSVSYCACGHQKSYKGFIWKYSE